MKTLEQLDPHGVMCHVVKSHQATAANSAAESTMQMINALLRGLGENPLLQHWSRRYALNLWLGKWINAPDPSGFIIDLEAEVRAVEQQWLAESKWN